MELRTMQICIGPTLSRVHVHFWVALVSGPSDVCVRGRRAPEEQRGGRTDRPTKSDSATAAPNQPTFSSCVLKLQGQLAAAGAPEAARQFAKLGK